MSHTRPTFATVAINKIRFWLYKSEKLENIYVTKETSDEFLDVIYDEDGETVFILGRVNGRGNVRIFCTRTDRRIDYSQITRNSHDTGLKFLPGEGACCLVINQPTGRKAILVACIGGKDAGKLSVVPIN